MIILLRALLLAILVTPLFAGDNTRTIQLRYAKAEAVMKTLQQASAGKPVTFASDAQSNRLIVTGPESEVIRACDLLRYLDLPQPHLKLEVVLESGEAGKPEAIWRGELTSASGEPAKLDLTGGTTLAAGRAAGKLTNLKGAFRTSVNPDNFCQIEAQLAASLDGPQGHTVPKFSGQVQARDGESATVAVLDTGAGHKMRLRLIPHVQKFGAPAADGF